MPRYAYGAKSTVEGCRSIDVLRWHHLGYLQHHRSFSWVWHRDNEATASIGVVAERDLVTLIYRIQSYGEPWEDVRQNVRVEWTPCRFGGKRPWFRCEVFANGIFCGRR